LGRSKRALQAAASESRRNRRESWRTARLDVGADVDIADSQVPRPARARRDSARPLGFRCPAALMDELLETWPSRRYRRARAAAVRSWRSRRYGRPLPASLRVGGHLHGYYSPQRAPAPRISASLLEAWSIPPLRSRPRSVQVTRTRPELATYAHVVLQERIAGRMDSLSARADHAGDGPLSSTPGRIVWIPVLTLVALVADSP
jgi:hypothetical protein